MQQRNITVAVPENDNVFTNHGDAHHLSQISLLRTNASSGSRIFSSPCSSPPPFEFRTGRNVSVREVYEDWQLVEQRDEIWGKKWRTRCPNLKSMACKRLVVVRAIRKRAQAILGPNSLNAAIEDLDVQRLSKHAGSLDKLTAWIRAHNV